MVLLSFAASVLDSRRCNKLIGAPPGTVLKPTLEGGKTVSLELGPPLGW